MAKIYTKGSTVADEVLSGSEKYEVVKAAGGAITNVSELADVAINLTTSVSVAGTTINAARLNNIETGVDTLDDMLVTYTTAGTTTAYTLTTPQASALATFERWRVKFNATAGVTPTLNRDAKGAKALKYYDSTGTKQACTSSNIVANLITEIVYDGTDYVVLDVAGVGSSNPWIEVKASWTYASANTITVPTDATTVYKKGMGIRWKQGGAYKYAYITIVAATLLTVTGGTDYTVANSAITDVAYTLSPKTALGLPVSFNAAFPTWNLVTVDNGSGGQPSSTGATSYFLIDGNLCTYAVVMGNNNAQKVGTDNQIQFAIPATLPTPSDGTLLPGGVAYTVAAAAGVVGISLTNGSNVDLRYSANIADNVTVPYTGCKITYKY